MSLVSLNVATRSHLNDSSDFCGQPQERERERERKDDRTGRERPGAACHPIAGLRPPQHLIKLGDLELLRRDAQEAALERLAHLHNRSVPAQVLRARATHGADRSAQDEGHSRERSGKRAQPQRQGIPQCLATVLLYLDWEPLCPAVADLLRRRRSMKVWWGDTHNATTVSVCASSSDGWGQGPVPRPFSWRTRPAFLPFRSTWPLCVSMSSVCDEPPVPFGIARPPQDLDRSP